MAKVANIYEEGVMSDIITLSSSVLPNQTADYDPSITLGELERRYIIKALEYFDGNKTQAAHALGITIKTLYNKLHEYGAL